MIFIAIAVAIIIAALYYRFSAGIIGSKGGRIGFAVFGVVLWFFAHSIFMRTPWIQRLAWSGPDETAILAAIASGAAVALLALALVVLVRRGSRANDGA